MEMHVAAGLDTVEAPLQRWQAVAPLVLDRRTRLGLGQEELALRTDPKASRSIVTQLERATKTSYKRKSLIGVSRALGWVDDAIENYVIDGVEPEERSPESGYQAPDGGRLRHIEESIGAMRQEQGAALRELTDLLREIAERFGLR